MIWLGIRCNLCPRRCNADRAVSLGFCGCGNEIKAARAALHFWEEPCISGSRGSGAVFFCGCNLKCVFCQNGSISRGNGGKAISAGKLGEIFLRLQSLGAHNINLVTPTHYVGQIKDALCSIPSPLTVPLVYNCGGYEAPEGLAVLKDDVSVYLTDIKYADSALSQKYSGASDYFTVAMNALKTMLSYVGTPEYNSEGIMQRGVIVRHLVLPGCRHDSINILRRLKSEFGTDSFRLSLMSQYTPSGSLKNFPEINRRITSFEYNSVTETALDLGFCNAYVQQRSSAKSEYTPPFDLTGII